MENTQPNTSNLDYIATKRYVDQAARIASGAPGENCPVILTASEAGGARIVGEMAHYTNRSGERVWSPNAYRRRGWSSLVYHPSTRRVECDIAALKKDAQLEIIRGLVLGLRRAASGVK